MRRYFQSFWGLETNSNRFSIPHLTFLSYHFRPGVIRMQSNDK
jgi:hypothetical protein